MRSTLAVLVVLGVAGCAVAPTRETQVQTAHTLTKEHFRDTAEVKDDPLDTVATLSTANNRREKRSIPDLSSQNNFLRANVDKKTGKAVFQLYQVIYYSGYGWNFYQVANYESPIGPQSQPATVIARDVGGCMQYVGCNYVEQVAFEIDESLLRRIAASYAPGTDAVWKFKFMAKSGRVYYDGMLPAELSGLLAKVDEYRKRNGLTQAALK